MRWIQVYHLERGMQGLQNSLPCHSGWEGGNGRECGSFGHGHDRIAVVVLRGRGVQVREVGAGSSRIEVIMEVMLDA
jgi:hypothetical protein